MPIEIQLPRLGWSMEEGKFLAWLKKEGDFVKEGEPLFTLESDKAAQEVESIDCGILSISANGPQPGDLLKVGHVLGHLLAEGESAPTPHPSTHKTKSQTEVQRPAQPKSNQSPAPTLLPRDFQAAAPASPRARRAARQRSVDLNSLQPSGKGGRICERDVLAATNTVAPAGFQQVPITPSRRTIAARLTLSRQTTVPVTITRRCDATQLVELRKQLKAGNESASNTLVPTLNDLLVKLTGAALRQHPLLTSVWSEDYLLVPDAIHIGIAVDVGDSLLVPVIRHADASSLTQITEQSQRLIAAARAGQLAASDMQGACFTVSNLGTLGVEAFTPVINPPESAILGIGAIVREAVPQNDGLFVARDRFTLSLTFDHRIIDGAAAARFLQSLAQLINQPALGLL